MTKRCPRCATVKSLEAFALRRKGGIVRQGWCRSCIAEAKRERRRQEARRGDA